MAAVDDGVLPTFASAEGRATAVLPAGADPLPRMAGGVVLRRLAPSDLAEFQAYRHDPVCGQWQGWTPMPDADARVFLAEMQTARPLQPGSWFQLGIAAAGDLRLIGDIGLLLAADGGGAEIGFTLSRPSQGRGLATLAVREAIEFVFQLTLAREVRALTDARNLPSVRLLERVGMQRAETRATTFRGAPCVEHLYVLRRAESG